MLAMLDGLRRTQNAGEDDRKKRPLLCDFREHSKRRRFWIGGRHLNLRNFRA